LLARTLKPHRGILGFSNERSVFTRIAIAIASVSFGFGIYSQKRKKKKKKKKKEKKKKRKKRKDGIPSERTRKFWL